MKVICISGKGRHGKDSTAIFLEEIFRGKGKRVLITHYADLLKYICHTFFGWDGKKNEAGRGLLQRTGTDIIRAKDPDYWVDFVAGLLKLFPNEWDYVLIPDCRFPNEAAKLTSNGHDTVHVRVVRPNFQGPLTQEQKEHISETAMDDYPYDHLVVNDGTLNDLREKVSALAEVII